MIATDPVTAWSQLEQEVVAAYWSGAKVSAVTERFGIGVGQYRNILRRAGIVLRQGGRQRSMVRGERR